MLGWYMQLAKLSRVILTETVRFEQRLRGGGDLLSEYLREEHFRQRRAETKAQ
jgi:hypothetical protein